MLQRRADWKVPSDAYLRERKAMLAELRINRERWARRRPAAYAFRLHAGCMYDPYCDSPGLKVAFPADSPRGYRDAPPRSMEEVFALLEDALGSDDVRVSRVRYHPRLGYPLRWNLDPPLPISHGRGVRRVRDFRALPPPGGSPARRTKRRGGRRSVPGRPARPRTHLALIPDSTSNCAFPEIVILRPVARKPMPSQGPAGRRIYPNPAIRGTDCEMV